MEPAHTRIKPAHTRIKPAHPHIKPAHTRIYDQPYIERGRLGEIEEERARESERERERARESESGGATAARVPPLLCTRPCALHTPNSIRRSTHPTPSEGRVEGRQTCRGAGRTNVRQGPVHGARARQHATNTGARNWGLGSKGGGRLPSASGQERRTWLPVISSRRGRLAPQSKAPPDGQMPLSRFRLVSRPCYLHSSRPHRRHGDLAPFRVRWFPVVPRDLSFVLLCHHLQEPSF